MAAAQQRAMVDDSVSLLCAIENAQNVGTHIEYNIRVQRGPLPENSWLVKKRYSDFVALDADLHISNIELPLPPKKVFGNMDREFVSERQNGLQHYLSSILNNLLLSSSLSVKKFLDPSNYSANLAEVALQHVSMVFRSELNWEMVEPLQNIGWRLRKHYFLVKPINEPKDRLVLCWSCFGPDRFIPEKETTAIVKLLSSIQHPYIYPIEFSVANENGAMIIRQFHEVGTLRDYIYKCKPKEHFLKKYAKPKSYQALQINKIQMYGRQILEALKFLQDKGLPYGNLHAGNIIISGNLCKLLDIETWLLGLPSYYKGYFMQFRKIQKMESIDVYCFGHLLYEMTFGERLNMATCDSFHPDCPPELRSVLESILTTEACKNGIPTISNLLVHTFFSNMVLPPTGKPQMKIPSKLKEAIRIARDGVENQLREQQKLLHQLKRFSKAKEFHMSEEEKMKRRKSKKKALENTKDNLIPTSPSPSPSPTSAVPAPELPPPLPQPGGVPPPPPPPTPTPSSPENHSVPSPSGGRVALLSSICNFSKTGLKKTVIKDQSAAKL